MEGLSSVTVFLPPPQMGCVTGALGTMAPGPAQAPASAARELWAPSPAFHRDGWRAIPGPPSSTVALHSSFPSTGFLSLRSVMQGIRQARAE